MFNGGVLDTAQGLAIQADDKIVVVGVTRVGSSDDFAIARFLPGGAPDTNFGTGGKTSVGFGSGFDKAWACSFSQTAASSSLDTRASRHHSVETTTFLSRVSPALVSWTRISAAQAKSPEHRRPHGPRGRGSASTRRQDRARGPCHRQQWN